jgi:hypothetical protein
LALKIVVGAREQGTPKRVLGDFTFLDIPLNFSVYLFSCIIDAWEFPPVETLIKNCDNSYDSR